MIDLRHLRHLIGVAEHGSFSRAAEALHLTQPALSRSIQALEASVGAPVFERIRGAIEPTELGRLLLRHARLLDAGAHDLDRDIALTKGLEIGELRIGVGPFGGSALIGPVVGRLSRLHPRLKVKLVLAPWQELPERVRARDVDLLVAELSEVTRLEDFETRALALHPVQPVCRRGHPLIGVRPLTLSQLIEHPLAGPALPEAVARTLLEAVPAHRRAGVAHAGLLTLECDSSTILKTIVAESDAVSMMPRFMVEADLAAGALAVLEGFDLGLQVQFGAAWLHRRSLSRAGERFVELLAAHDAGLAQAAKPAPSARRRSSLKSRLR